jgi:urease accessory protein
MRDTARAALEGAASECGASAWNGMLVARFISPDPQVLRADIVRFLERFRGAPMPRSWQT